MVSLMAYAGLRPSEVNALAWEDIGDQTLVVRAARSGDDEKGTKTGSVRSVPICEPLAEDLAALGRFGELVVGPGARPAPNWRRRIWDPATARPAAPR